MPFAPLWMLLPALLAVDLGAMPLVVPESAVLEVRPAQLRIYRAAEKQARFLLGKVHPWAADPALKLLTESAHGEHHVRPNAGAVMGFAFLYRFGPFDAANVGVDRPSLFRDAIEPMIRYLVATHVTGDRPTSDGKPWGDDWQSALWTGQLAHAAWWVWDDLPADLREATRRVVAHEADRVARMTPPHQVERDTKAEENAWNSQALDMAVILMPDDPRRPGWEAAFQRWALSSFLRPADATNPAIVDGRPVAEQFTGANIRDDHTLENHDIVHPDYMTTFSLSLGSALDYAMTRRQPPEALWHNVAGLYENLKWFILPDGGFIYPNGQDWELFRNPDWLSVHVQMAVFGRDPDAWSLALATLDTLEAMRAATTTGAVFEEGDYFFPSTQTDMLDGLAAAWLDLQVATAPPVDAPRPRLGVRHLEAGKILLNRTPAAIHAVSWGARVMVQCVPFRKDRIVSPDQRDGVGSIRYQDEDRPAAIVFREAKIDHAADHFAITLVYDHGEGRIRATLNVRSEADGRLVLGETLVALADATTSEIATGLIGVLNNPRWVYESGRRRVALGEKETIVPAGSGQTLAGRVADVAIDGVLKIHSAEPLNVLYAAATRAERARHTDRLYLNHVEGKRSWRRGETISRYEVAIEAESP